MLAVGGAFGGRVELGGVGLGGSGVSAFGKGAAGEGESGAGSGGGFGGKGGAGIVERGGGLAIGMQIEMRVPLSRNWLIASLQYSLVVDALRLPEAQKRNCLPLHTSAPYTFLGIDDQIINHCSHNG